MVNIGHKGMGMNIQDIVLLWIYCELPRLAEGSRRRLLLKARLPRPYGQRRRTCFKVRVRPSFYTRSL